MEALLSLAFDSLSSFDGPRVRKGMRQVEGLLAQICLSDPADDDDGNEARPASSSSSSPSSPPPKDLARLSCDPAFREFFKLQEGFEWNVALRLIGTLDRLMAKGSNGQNDILILSALDLIQGLLLLHPPSKALFAREQNMKVRPASPPPPFPPRLRGGPVDEARRQGAAADDRAAPGAIAPPRPPRALQLPRHPVGHAAHPRRRPRRRPRQHAHV